MRFPGTWFFVFLLMAVTGCAGEFRIVSPDFANGGAIPSRFTCEGQNTSPALEISGIPSSAHSLALVVDDPDAPSGTFTHWLVWNIAPGTAKIPGGAVPAGAVEGTNDFGTAGYSGPCPPSGTHRYIFHLFALNAPLHLAPGASRKDLDAAIKGHIIATAILMGRYAKSGSR